MHSAVPPCLPQKGRSVDRANGRNRRQLLFSPAHLLLAQLDRRVQPANAPRASCRALTLSRLADGWPTTPAWFYSLILNKKLPSVNQALGLSGISFPKVPECLTSDAVDPERFELSAFSMPLRRAPNCAMGPYKLVNTSHFFRVHPSGPGGIRTLGLLSAIEARSQLRYRPVLDCARILHESPVSVKEFSKIPSHNRPIPASVKAIPE